MQPCSMQRLVAGDSFAFTDGNHEKEVTYKELFGGGSIAEGVLLRRRLHGGGHVDVDEVGSPGLLVELSFEGRQEGIARHGPAGGAGAV